MKIILGLALVTLGLAMMGKPDGAFIGLFLFIAGIAIACKKKKPPTVIYYQPPVIIRIFRRF